ncbi:thioredoxin [Eubacterium coprostanoligenes]|uniref:Thioredoxin n=1 Tax=Eubacterium coprostanoligenes TaxID=290054 RepID=A0A1T4M5K6_9FIRM|nr:thioredoxin [Eubacterium coprostanoligenes]MCI6253939.1 thioredoxin [Eubacterium coprostanoligenes]MCI6354306.1 thioredoxin [Eubacterium coprostanoligenes]MCI6360327.1 thioredoxin [Eubacterium coprostanoligenes]MCI7264450.1 thioredoxin [Eubacterium coprostanoligenes]MDD6665398.1 thioredoxin [Eubacterium coprostanoligenes]
MTIEVTAQNFDEEVLNYKGKVLVDFWAEWCGPCMMLGPIIEEVSEEVDDVKFCKVNCDEARDVALQFGIMTIPNLIVFENGEQVNQSIGYIEKEDVLKLIK